MKETRKEPSPKRHDRLPRAVSGRTTAVLPDGMSNRAVLALLRPRPSPARAGSPPPPRAEDVVARSGQPLEPDVRQDAGQRFGHEFGAVRVHTDAIAATSARAMGARAYTVGRNIVFGEGQYAPRSPQGAHLLAHELAHVVQQGRGGETPAVDPDAAHERDAGVAAKMAVSGGHQVSVSAGTGIGVARSPLDVFDTSMPDLRPWVNQTPDLRRWSTDRLQTTLDRIERWLAAQTSSSAQTVVAETAVAQIRDALGVFGDRPQLDRESWFGIDFNESESPEAAAKRARRARTVDVFTPLPNIELRDRYQEILYRFPTDAAWRNEFDLETLEQIVEERFPDSPPWLDREYFHQQLGAATWTWYQRQQLDKLRNDTTAWLPHERAIAIELLASWFELRADGQTAGDIHDALLARFADFYDRQLRAADKMRMDRCAAGDVGRIERTQGQFAGDDPCKSWFKEDDPWALGPLKLEDFRRALRIVGNDDAPMIIVFYWVQEYRKLTNPDLIQQAHMAAAMLNVVTAFATPGGGPRGTGAVPRGAPKPPARPVTGPDPNAIQGGGQKVSGPQGQLSVVHPDNTIGAPYQPNTPVKTPPTPGAPIGGGAAGWPLPGQPANENVPETTSQHQQPAVATGGGGPVMTRRIITPPVKPKAPPKADPRFQRRNPIQEHTVKEPEPPEDTHQVKRNIPGAVEQPLPLEAGNFAQDNFNRLADVFDRAGIKSDRPISESLPAGAGRYKIEAYPGSVKGREPEIDALDRQNGVVIEIKPHNEYEQGLREARAYAQDMDDLHPLPPIRQGDKVIRRRWQARCLTYDGEAMRQYWQRVRPPRAPEGE